MYSAPSSTSNLVPTVQSVNVALSKGCVRGCGVYKGVLEGLGRTGGVLEVWGSSEGAWGLVRGACEGISGWDF